MTDRSYKLVMAATTPSGDTRERILESATELMHERGYEAVGVAEICERASVNKGSFYHFFRTKENLCLSVIDSYWEKGRGMFDCMSDAGSPIEQLRRFFGTIGKYHKQSKAEHGCVRGCLLGNLALELAPQTPAVQQRLSSIFTEQTKVLAGLVRRAVAAKELPAQDADQSAENIVAYLEGIILISKVRNDPTVFEPAVPAMMKLLGANEVG